MVLTFNAQSVLREPNMEMIVYLAQHLAVELTLLGQVDAARELASLVCSRGPQSTPWLDNFTRPLEWAWRETGRWPDAYPEDSKSSGARAALQDHCENAYWGCIFTETEVPEDKRHMNADGLEACLDAVEAALRRPGQVTDEMGISMLLAKALDISYKLDLEQDGLQVVAGSGELSDPKVCEEIKLDQRTLGLLNEVISRWYARFQQEALINAQHLWPLYISGTLATALKVPGSMLQRKTDLILKTFNQRFTKRPACTSLPRLHSSATRRSSSALMTVPYRRNTAPVPSHSPRDIEQRTGFFEHIWEERVNAKRPPLLRARSSRRTPLSPFADNVAGFTQSPVQMAAA